MFYRLRTKLSRLVIRLAVKISDVPLQQVSFHVTDDCYDRLYWTAFEDEAPDPVQIEAAARGAYRAYETLVNLGMSKRKDM